MGFLTRFMIEYYGLHNYEYARTNDKVLTHTLINPTFNFEIAKLDVHEADA